MGVLQGFYKLRPDRAVPSPYDGDSAVPWWWDHLAAQANNFRKAGFSAVWLPPVLKISAGANPGSDDYGPYRLERSDGLRCDAVRLARSQNAGGPIAGQDALDATRIGYHGLRIALSDMPEAARPAYKLRVAYAGSHRLPAEAGEQGVAQPSTPPAAIADPKEVGRWDPPFPLTNVAIHLHLLPNGKVLLWGRRDRLSDTLDEHVCTPQLWDPATRRISPTPQPMRVDGKTTVNLFCSGHTFLPDGRLLVVGGHFADSQGIDQASVYDYRTNSWTALPAMNSGRWYPTAVTLHDGTALVMSGSFAGADGKIQTNEVQEVWDGRQWRQLVNFHGMPLFPRAHMAPNGQVFMSGPLAQSYMLDTNGPGIWTPLQGKGGSRANSQRDYAPSVMYDVGKVIYIGGGNDPGTHVPTSACEIIDLTAATPAWRPSGNMHHRRRQHNATILPDGTVLVTGGTQGGGGKNDGFNDLTPHQPVHEAELWDPATGQWTELAAEAVDRCYHSTAILLPDATVLSAGGGEYRPDSTDTPNPPQDSHRDAQIYHPPYLFRGPRPDLVSAPEEVSYGQSFTVGTSRPEEIALISMIRLSSVTHAFNMDQRINFPAFHLAGNALTVAAPAGPDDCPPGHYMLFLLNKDKIPSVARILRVAAAPGRAVAAFRAVERSRAEIPAEARLSTAELDRAVTADAAGTRVAVGLTSRCPYGLGACWGGAYEALRQLDGVRAVRPIANAKDSTAEVTLHGNTLPHVDRWAEQIERVANGSYDLRGIEISLRANLHEENGDLRLAGPLLDEKVTLKPFEPAYKVQFDRPTGTTRPATERELSAYDRLAARYREAGSRELPVHVIGPLKRTDAGLTLYVRDFHD